jgi:hypothetical protein
MGSTDDGAILTMNDTDDGQHWQRWEALTTIWAALAVWAALTMGSTDNDGQH